MIDPAERAWRCWCGEEGDPDEMMSGDLYDGCGGTGTLHCYCGGDFCVCHNHGEVQCSGCEDCEPDGDDLEDGYAYPDEFEEPDRYEHQRLRGMFGPPKRKPVKPRAKRRGGRLLSMKERGRL